MLSLRVQRARSPWSARGLALLWVILSGGLLAIAANLQPDPAGYGTHRQLPAGLGASWYAHPAPCSMMTFLGIPCPTCGMTTAFAHAVRGAWLRAFQVQPAGAFLALATVATLLGSSWTLVTGQVWRLGGSRIHPLWIVLPSVGLVLGSWVYKVVMVRQSLGRSPFGGLFSRPCGLG